MFCGLPSSVMKINVRHQLSLCTTIFCFQQILMLEWGYLWSPDPKSWRCCVGRFLSQKRDPKCPLNWGWPWWMKLGGSPWCCPDFPEVFISYMDLPLQSLRHGISFPMDSRTRFHTHFACRNNNAFLAIWNHSPIHTRALKLSGGKGKHGKINQKWLFIFECVIWSEGGQTLSSRRFNLNCLTRGYFGRRVKWRRFKFSHKVGKYILGFVQGFLLCGGEGSIHPVFILHGKKKKKMEKVTKSREDKKGSSPVDGRERMHGWGTYLWTLANSIFLLEVPTRAELAIYY